MQFYEPFAFKNLTLISFFADPCSTNCAPPGLPLIKIRKHIRLSKKRGQPNLKRRIMNTCKTTVLILIALLIVHLADGQGENLFKAKCSTCHIVDRASTGPLLKGVKQKWTDAGEGALLYKWVQNSVALINSKQSKMALAIRDFNAGDMSPQQVTPQEVDAILDYVDTYQPIVINDTTTTGIVLTGSGPDYEGNLVLFYWLFALLVFLLIAILIMTNTTLALMQSERFRNRLPQHQKKQYPGLLTIVLIGCITLIGNPLYAFDFVEAGSTTEKTPWLLVETFDLYLMLGVDVLLIGVVYYLKHVFNEVMEMIGVGMD